MKKTFSSLLALASIVGILTFTQSFKQTEKAKELQIGDKATGQNIKLEDTNGKKFTIADLKKEKGLLVIFSCNTCPFVVAWEDRYNELYHEAAKNGIASVLVNSNEAKRSNDDSMEAMKKHAAQMAYKMPYALDKNNQLADAFGARTTPHVFLFDQNMTLVYKGAIDDNYESKDKVKKTYLLDAINELSAGNEIENHTTKAMGCSIKRVKV